MSEQIKNPERDDLALNNDADDTPVVRNDGAFLEALSGISNTRTGLGTSRDKNTATNVSHYITKLDINQRVALVRSSRICRRAVEAYPIAAGGVGWRWVFGGASSSAVVAKMDKYCDRIQLKQALVQASIEARWHGDGYILIGAADGLDMDQPLGKVKTIDFLFVLGQHEVKPGPGQQHKEYPEYYHLSNIDHQGTVHASRIIRLRGDRLSGYALQVSGGENDSVLQTMLNDFVQFSQGLAASTGMLADYSVFLYKLDGLAKMVAAGQTEELLKRFISIQMGMSVTQGLMMDAKNEDGSFIQRSYAGVKEIMDLLAEQLVAASDMPRSKLLGAAAQVGLATANRGQNDREDWEIARHDWQENNWREPLLTIGNIILSASDGPQRASKKDFDVAFPSGLGLSAKDQAEIRHIDSQRFKLDIESGQITADEARQSRYGNAEYSNEITLLQDKAPVLEEPDKKPGAEEEPEESGKQPKTPKAKESNAEEPVKKPKSTKPKKDVRQDAMNLDELANVTQKDLDAAREAWEKNPPDSGYDGILAAK